MTPVVLVVAGVDSGGGAGMLRDCATAHDLGVSVRVAVTAVTAQDDQGVRAVHLIPPEIVAAQIAAAGPIGAIKIGMLGTAAIVAAVAGSLPAKAPIVLDPVLQSSSGHCLLDPPGVRALVRNLIPRATLLTPNMPELFTLGELLGLSDHGETAIVAALQHAGTQAVLVKGGHAGDTATCEDRLYWQHAEVVSFSSRRLPGSLRGTGCQLATGIAAELARGKELPDAIHAARDLLRGRFEASIRHALR